MKDLQNAFNLLKVSDVDRVHIVMELHKSNVLKAQADCRIDWDPELQQRGMWVTEDRKRVGNEARVRRDAGGD